MQRYSKKPDQYLQTSFKVMSIIWWMSRETVHKSSEKFASAICLQAPGNCVHGSDVKEISWLKSCKYIPAGIYMFKVNKRNTRTIICSPCLYC